MFRFYMSAFCAMWLMGPASPPAHAAKTIFRCVQNGQVTLADHPCEPAPSAEQSRDGESASALLGTWQGQVEARGRLNGHDTVPKSATLSLELLPDGKLSGTIAAEGCKIVGSWSHADAHQTEIEAVLSACRVAASNRRYSGNLVLSGTEGTADLSLSASTVPEAGQGAATYSIKGPLHR